MPRFETFAASCSRLGGDGQAPQRIPPLDYYSIEVERRGELTRNFRGAYRVDSSTKTPFRADGSPDATSFFAAVFAAARQRTGGSDPVVIVHIHGFASTPQTAAERAAELTKKYRPYRLGGAPAVLSFMWPSEGRVVEFDAVDWKRPTSGLTAVYRRERVVARQSAQRLIELMTALSEARRADVAQHGGNVRLVLLAHSMGTWVVQNAGRLARNNAVLRNLGPAPLFDLAFLMAGDCEYTALDPRADLTSLGRICSRTHVYYAPQMDGVVHFSPGVSSIGGRVQRLGHNGPSAEAKNTFPGLGWLDCDDFAKTIGSDSNHQYYRLSKTAVKAAQKTMDIVAAGDASQSRSLLGEQRAVSGAIDDFRG